MVIKTKNAVFEIYRSCTLVEETPTFIKIEKITIPNTKNMVPKNIPHKAGYMTCKSLEQAQRDSTSRKGKPQERRGHMKGFSEEFIAPMWNPVKK